MAKLLVSPTLIGVARSGKLDKQSGWNGKIMIVYQASATFSAARRRQLRLIDQNDEIGGAKAEICISQPDPAGCQSAVKLSLLRNCRLID